MNFLEIQSSIELSDPQKPDATPSKTGPSMTKHHQVLIMPLIPSRQGISPGKFENPVGAAVSPDGAFVVADRDNQRVQMFAGDGR